jgi:hypothetical protein
MKKKIALIIGAIALLVYLMPPTRQTGENTTEVAAISSNNNQPGGTTQSMTVVTQADGSVIVSNFRGFRTKMLPAGSAPVVTNQPELAPRN